MRLYGLARFVEKEETEKSFCARVLRSIGKDLGRLGRIAPEPSSRAADADTNFGGRSKYDANW